MKLRRCEACGSYLQGPKAPEIKIHGYCPVCNGVIAERKTAAQLAEEALRNDPPDEQGEEA